MGDRTDAKLRDVAIARYVYRHEAEFAAGFLDDAEIPYRLQVDDASMGLGLSSTATIWVRGIDAERARDVLEIDDGPAYLQRSVDSGSERRLSAPGRSGGSRSPVSPGGRSDSARRAVDGVRSLPPSRLTVRERALALLAAGGVVVVGQLLVTEATHVALRQGIPLLAAFLAITALVGWAPKPVRRLLAALSGNAP